ncbi:MAG: hypothetical protein M5U34_16070 [Chloroflexi bacterium]|nr:hypothetical protein [Chloroflexota bacterium]
MLDEPAIQAHFAEALAYKFKKHRQIEKRSRLGDSLAVEQLTPEDPLHTYGKTIGLDAAETHVMQALAGEVLGESEQ